MEMGKFIDKFFIHLLQILNYKNKNFFFKLKFWIWQTKNWLVDTTIIISNIICLDSTLHILKEIIERDYINNCTKQYNW